MNGTVVIVGAGRCGASAAQTLRSEGFDGQVIMLGDEDDPPYERPPLSKEYLQGKQEREHLLIRPQDWFAGAGIELRTSATVTAVDPGSRLVRLADGEAIRFARLLLATGGRPRTPPGGHERVRYLRTLADARRLRGDLSSAEHVVIVGAGFIGAEIAASARYLGTQVTMLEMLNVPLARALGDEIGSVLAEVHRDHGVTLRTREGLAGISELGDGSLRVHTTQGQDVDCDLVVAGVGITPRTELAAAAGITVDNGIVVDECCRTSAPGVYAAGDVASHFHPLAGCHIRVEHDDNAIRQGAAAARSMLGQDAAYDDPHWFWSDQYDLNLQCVGYCSRWDRVVVRGSLAERRFSAFYLVDGTLRAAVAVNRPEDVLRARKLIRRRRHVAAGVLADENADLRRV